MNVSYKEKNSINSIFFKSVFQLKYSVAQFLLSLQVTKMRRTCESLGLVLFSIPDAMFARGKFLCNTFKQENYVSRISYVAFKFLFQMLETIEFFFNPLSAFK